MEQKELKAEKRQEYWIDGPGGKFPLRLNSWEYEKLLETFTWRAQLGRDQEKFKQKEWKRKLINAIILLIFE